MSCACETARKLLRRLRESTVETKLLIGGRNGLVG